jgi:hypothetical protein
MRGFGGRRKEAKVGRESIRRSERKYAKRCFGANERLQDFVNRAIPPAGKHGVEASVDASQSLDAGAAGRVCLKRLDVEASLSQYRHRFVNGRSAAGRVLSGSRVIDERHAAHG